MTAERVLLEGIIRGTAAGLYLASGLVLLRLKPRALRAAGTLAYASKTAHVIAQFPPAIALLGIAAPGFTFAGVLGAGLTWIFAAELFEAKDRFDIRRLAPIALVAVVGLAGLAAPPRIALSLWLLHTFLSIALMTHVLVMIGNAWRNPWAGRQSIALTLPFLLSAAYSVGVGFVQTVEVFNHAQRQPSLLAALYLLFSSAVALVVFSRPTPQLVADLPASVRARPPAAASGVLTAPDAALASALNSLMRKERLYRTQNLRISALALKLGVPEHRLRQLLNHSLGFRNFNAYISEWRLAEAKEALSDPEQTAVPISTIAIDSGYQSLAPFNRAFKAETGMTPKEFRAKAAATADAPATTDALQPA